MARRISHGKQIVLAFFLGAATTNIAFDLVDYVFYGASTSNFPLSPQEQAFLFAWFGLIYYAAFFALGYLLYKFTSVGAEFVLYLYAATIVVAILLTSGLPQSSDPFFFWTAWLGTAVSFGIIYGLRREVRGR